MKKDFNNQDYYSQVKIRFTSFINVVIRNASINYKRKNTILKEKEIQDVNSLKDTFLSSDGDVSFFDVIENDYNYKHLENYFSDSIVYMAVKQLNEIQKKILYYRILKKYSYKTIANLLNISEANVRNTKLRTIKKVNEFIERRKSNER